MKLRGCLLAFLLLGAQPAQAAVSLDEIAQRATALRAEEATLNAQREATFQKAFNQQQQLLNGVASQRANFNWPSNSNPLTMMSLEATTLRACRAYPRPYRRRA